MDLIPYEIIHKILSELTTRNLSVVRGTSTLFKIIADDISYNRAIISNPNIDRPISIYVIYKRQMINYTLYYDLIRLMGGSAGLTYPN